jgi:hypothetical protein
MRDSTNSRSIHDAAQRLADIDSNFNIRDPECSDPDGNRLNPDPKDKDPNAKKRLTASRNESRDGLRPVLIRKAFRAYMAWAPKAPKHWRERTTTKVVDEIWKSWVSKGWAKAKGFDRTIRRGLSKK